MFDACYPAPMHLPTRLLQTGQQRLAAWTPALDVADPDGRVTPAARLLCCSLGHLAATAAHARGADDVDGLAHAAAGLALLTKIDDEHIDARAFHGGPATDRASLRARTTRFLAPTLAALHTGVPDSPEPRVHLAAEVGRLLAAHAVDDARLHALLDLITRGWHIQVDAVEVLSARPGSLPLARVRRVTAAISGAWLAMITAVGLLGADRGPTPDEEAAFFAWGLPIQSADALADLEKDLADDFAGSLPVCLALARRPALYAAWEARDGAGLRTGIVATGADRAMLPDPDHLQCLDRRLAALGEVPTVLRWIHGFLLGRHLARSPGTPGEPFAPFVSDWSAFRPTHAPGATCLV